MNDNDIKKRMREIFSKNLNYYMDRDGINRKTLSNKLNVPYTTISDWVNGKSYPHTSKIEELANIFKISKANLIEDGPPPLIAPHDEAWEIRRELQAKPHLKVLLAISANASKENIKKITEILEIFSE